MENGQSKPKVKSKTKKYLVDIFTGREWKIKLPFILLVLAIVFAAHFTLYAIYGDAPGNPNPDVIDFSPVKNKGMAYGFLNTRPEVAYALESIFTVLLLLFFLATKQKKIYMPLSMMFAGGLANLINRIIDPDGVFDYIWVDFGTTVFRFTANVPDIFVFVGAVSLVFGLIFYVISEIRSSRPTTDAKKTEKKQ